MSLLSPAYERVKRLRSIGSCAAAVATLRAQPPASDRDAFEAVVCLFVCGDIASALNVCRTHAWKEEWAGLPTRALSELIADGDMTRALSFSRKSVGMPGAPFDASAIHLLLLQEARLIDEADAYMKSRLQDPPHGETFLLTMMAEMAVAARNWRQAYRAASAVLAADPDDYRALLALSIANFEIGNVHESLGNAHRANAANRGATAAILQIMRCQNKLGDYYAALAAFDQLKSEGAIPGEMHLELGTAYSGLKDSDRAVAEYRAASAPARHQEQRCVHLLRFMRRAATPWSCRRLPRNTQSRFKTTSTHVLVRPCGAPSQACRRGAGRISKDPGAGRERGRGASRPAVASARVAREA